MTSAYIHPTIQAQNQSFLYINVKTNRVTKMLQNYIWYFKPSAFPININYIKTCFAMFYTIMYRNVTFVGALIKLQIKWLRFQGKPAHCAPLPAHPTYISPSLVVRVSPAAAAQNSAQISLVSSGPLTSGTTHQLLTD